MRNRPALVAMVAMVAMVPAGYAHLPDPPALVLPPALKRPRLEHIEKAHAAGLLGQPVLDLQHKPIGNIVNVLIDQTGTPKAAIIEFAGFLGVGDRNIAVAWSALHFAPASGKITITVTLSAARLKALPAYKSGAASVPIATQPHPKVTP